MIPKDQESKIIELDIEAMKSQQTDPKKKLPEYVTGDTILSLQKVTYDSETGRNIKISTFNQIDGKLSFGLTMAAKMMPKITLDWFNKLERYINDQNTQKEED
jgi:hypothetical protein